MEKFAQGQALASAHTALSPLSTPTQATGLPVAPPMMVVHNQYGD